MKTSNNDCRKHRRHNHSEMHRNCLIIVTLCCIIDSSANFADSKPIYTNSSEQTTVEQIQDPVFMEEVSNIEYQYKREADPFMLLYKLSLSKSNNITCNDGSNIGYYKRLNNHSKSWIIYLQGGGFCASEESCNQRWQRTPHLMSSNYWPKTKTVDGILSSELKDNPYLWNANHVYVPYCSSDSWTGQLYAGLADSSQKSASFSFLGSKIVEQVIESLYEDLPRDYSLYEAKSILLAGDSAGATGVILNLDKVSDFIENKANLLRTNCARNDNHNVALSLEERTNCQQKQQNRQPLPIVRGLADSGWFLDNEPYLESTYLSDFELFNNDNCDQTRCTPLQSIKQAMRYWNGQVSDACFDRYSLEPWRCYFGYRAYQTLKTPLFVVQWLYDEAQLMIDHISRPDTSNQWNYVNKVSNEMRESLENVTALFAPSCFSHSLVIKRSWNEITINGFKLPHILNTWEEQALLDINNTAIPNTSDNYHRLSSLVIPDDQLAQQQYQQDGLSTFFLVDQASLGSSSTFETTTQMGETKNLQQQEKGSSQRTNILPTSSKEVVRATIGGNIKEYSLPIISHQQTHSKTISSSNTNNVSRIRSRKRKRNNNSSGSQRTRQIRQKNPLALEGFTQDSGSGHLQTKESYSHDTFTIQPASPLQDLLLPLLDRPPEIYFGRVNSRNASGQISNLNVAGGRPGRSTLLSGSLIEDATLMLSNNVPDDTGSSSSQVPTNSNLNDNRADYKRWSWMNTESRLSNNPASPFHLNIQPTTSRSSDDRFRLIDSCAWPQCNRDCPALELDFNSPVNIQF